jgi:2-C-methyl-D-erythritol 4-phosphate cytidylyltransferase
MVSCQLILFAINNQPITINLNMNTAIIVAAGSGLRFGGKTPKQFVEILGKPLIIHTLERFETCSSVDRIILVLSSDQIEKFSQISAKYPLTKLSEIVAGGRTRAESVRNGLAAVPEKTAGIIAVHDGARPLVTGREIAETIEKARETGAACLVAEVTDTIKEVSRDRIIGTVDRTQLRRAQTPQCFRFEILKKAFDQADLSETVTDECYLVEKLGWPIALVEGSWRNIKVTNREDLVLAENFLRQK